MGLFLRSKAGLAISIAAALVLAAAVIVAIELNSETQHGVRHTASHHTRRRLAVVGTRWLITSEAITQLMDNGAARGLVANAFGGHRSYVIDNSGPPGIGTSVATFSSYDSIRRALASRRLPGRYTAVIYDNEDWPGTPRAEQRNPARYERLVANLLHKHGLLYIATPALDLVKVLNPRTSNAGRLRAYLLDGMAADAARYADVIDIQAQRVEQVTSEYAKFVASAAAQARKANPHVVVLAGLRSVRSITPGELSAAYSSVRSVVNGYWLNIPGPASKCPTCQPVYPQPALELLKQIYG
jgi:hypothetical protein